jgi:hypothetical protein
MNKTVKDGIRNRGVWDPLVPVSHGNLGDNRGGAATVAIIQDFKQVSGLGTREGVSEPVIKDEQLDTGQGAQQLGIGAVGVSQFQRLEQAGSALVANFAPDLTSGPTKSASQVRFPCSSRAEDKQVEMAIDPLTLGQLQNLAPVEAAFGGQVKVFYGGNNWEVGRLDATAQAVVSPASGLDVDQQAEALLEGQLSILGIVKLLFQRSPETGQMEFSKFVE